MSTVLLVLVVVLVVAGLVYGVVSLLTGDDPGLAPVDPDGVARPLPNNRSLSESDLKTVRFDVELRGYRMSQVDRVLRRTAYDVGYKDEMIAVLEAEVTALREGRLEDAELLRKARESASSTSPAPAPAGTAAGTPAVDVDVAGFAVVEVGVVEEEADQVEGDSDELAFPYVDTGTGRLNRAALRRVDDEPEAPGSDWSGEAADEPADEADESETDDEADPDAGTGDDGDLIAEADPDAVAGSEVEPDADSRSDADAVPEEPDEVEAGASARRGGRA